MPECGARQYHGYGVQEVEDKEDDGHVRVESDGFLGAEGGKEGGKGSRLR